MIPQKNELGTDSKELVHKKLTYIIRINTLKSFTEAVPPPKSACIRQHKRQSCPLSGKVLSMYIA
jgi:hypothetical protein